MSSASFYIGFDEALIDKKPRKPAEPRETATTCINPAKIAAIPEPIKAQKNGNLYFKLTPNKAGSVIPSKAETPAEDARPFIFLSFVNVQTANVAAPCATLAIEATTKIKSPAPLPLLKAVISWVSIAGKLWCNPVNTIAD